MAAIATSAVMPSRSRRLRTPAKRAGAAVAAVTVGAVGARCAGAPCRFPQLGQVHHVVPGGMWNRRPQFSHVANTHRAPQRTHV